MHEHGAHVAVRKPRIGFEDIAGYDDIKEKVREMVVLTLRRGRELESLGVEPPRGVLLWGPLGSGKAMLAEAAAKEADVMYVYLRGREVTHDLECIEEAFRLARENEPCVFHISDLDWLAPRKGASYEWEPGNEFGKPERFAPSEVTERLFELLDELLASKLNLVVVGSTYRIDVIDPSLYRIDRLSRKIYVPPPRFEDRLALLRYFTRGMRLDGSVDLEELARRLRLYVAWDIEAVCRRAALEAVKDGSDSIRMEHFLRAIEKVPPTLTDRMIEMYEQMYRMDCVHKYNY